MRRGDAHDVQVFLEFYRNAIGANLCVRPFPQKRCLPAGAYIGTLYDIRNYMILIKTKPKLSMSGFGLERRGYEIPYISA